MKYEKNTLMQASKCKLMHQKAVHKLEHDIIPRDLLTTKTPTPPQTEALPSPWYKHTLTHTNPPKKTRTRTETGQDKTFFKQQKPSPLSIHTHTLTPTTHSTRLNKTKTNKQSNKQTNKKWQPFLIKDQIKKDFGWLKRRKKNPFFFFGLMEFIINKEMQELTIPKAG